MTAWLVVLAMVTTSAARAETKKPVVILKTGTPAEAGLDAKKLDALYAYVGERTRHGLPGAVVLVARHGVIAGERAFGVKDRKPDEPMTIDTLFDLESVTKIATAALALALADDGVIAMSDPIAKWVPATAAKQVTIEDALAHASGLPMDVDHEPTDSAAAIWKRIDAAKPERPPRKQVGYSDLGYRMVGRALAAAAHEPLDRLMRRRLLDPLGLRDTVYTPPASLRPRIAGTGPSKRFGRSLRGEITDSLDTIVGGVVGCDGLFATARDLATLAQLGLAGGAGVISRAAATRMTTNQTPFVDVAKLPAGWLAAIFNGPKTLGWEFMTPQSWGGALSKGASCKGGIAGTFVCIDPATDLVVVYLTNLGVPASFDDKDLTAWYTTMAPDRVVALAAAAVLR